MDNENLLGKLRLIRDMIDEDPDEAGAEIDQLIEELEPLVDGG